MKKQNEPPKSHHQVSIGYQSKFTDIDRLLWIFDKDQNIYDKRSPIVTAVENGYYSFIEKDGTTNTDIETKILKPVDAKIPSIIDKIENQQILNKIEHEDLAEFVALQRLRVPDFESKLQINIEGFKKEDRLDFMKHAKELLEYFLSVDWMIVTARQGSSFILSDNPFCPCHPDAFNGKELMIDTPGVESFIPLSKKTCLVFGNKGNHIIYKKNLDKVYIRQINIFTALNSKRYIMSHDKSLLENIVKKSQMDKGYKKEYNLIKS
ncbi:DUF4238 domain-containing protein [Candidatus Peregrinibacteria bacterium]|nr:DUF4238 domain-containing protein [Candidatus Peregrinibacteria bacterium]